MKASELAEVTSRTEAEARTRPAAHPQIIVTSARDRPRHGRSARRGARGGALLGVRMLKLIIGNKAYSSWSLRGWLAVKHSGLPFEEITVPMFDEAWDKRAGGRRIRAVGRQGADPVGRPDRDLGTASRSSNGSPTRPIGRATGPRDDTARGMARSMAAEMHSSYPNLRRELGMKRAQAIPSRKLSAPVRGRGAAHPRTLGAGAGAPRHRPVPISSAVFGAVDIMLRPRRHPLRHLFGPRPPLRRSLYRDDPRPCLDEAMDRGGAGRALGDRAI